jgi:hypothetical protein
MSEISTYVSSSPEVPPKPGSPGKPQPGRAVAILPVDGGTEPLRTRRNRASRRPPQRSRPDARLLEPAG